MKNEIKNQKRIEQDNKCYITQKELDRANQNIDLSKFRKTKDGGQLNGKNSSVVDPVEHMKVNGNYRERSEILKALKILVDGRESLMKTKQKLENQLTAIARGVDETNEDIDSEAVGFIATTHRLFVSKLNQKGREIEKFMEEHGDQFQIVQAAKDVHGVGPMTLAYCLVYIDIEKADTVSKLWSYTGLHKPDHKRYEKDENNTANPGNKKLRCAIWNMADSQVRTKGAYRHEFDRQKERLSNSEQITNTRIPGSSAVVRKPWKDVSDGHRNEAAKRSVMKLFLSDYLHVARTLAGLPMRNIYAEDKLGHQHITYPTERGWSLSQAYD